MTAEKTAPAEAEALAGIIIPPTAGGGKGAAARPSVEDLQALAERVYRDVPPELAVSIAKGCIPPQDDASAEQVLAAGLFISRDAPGALREDEVRALGAAVAGWCRGEDVDWPAVAAVLGDVERRLLGGDAADDGDDEGKKRESQAQALVRLAQEAELSHDAEGVAWATVQVNGHLETHRVRGKGFRAWLARRFWDEAGKPPGAQAMQDALAVIEARAVFDGPETAVHIRVAEHSGKVYVDLGDPAWRAVEVDATGWRVVAAPPVRFWRPRGMLALPEPVRGGSLQELRRFVPCDDEGWVLFLAWLIGALAPRGPYPILAAEGEQGSGKSTACRIARALVDPAACALRRPPREERDLFVAARNAWVVGFDNLSGLPDWLSDALCVLATGGGFPARALYTDDEEAVLSAQRPVILNGIDQVGARADFRDRCLRVVFPQPLEDAGKALDEATVWTAFEEARPRIFGALLDAVSMALRRWDEVQGVRLPRMADHARWVLAAEPALPWEPGTFLRVYAGQRASMAREAVEDSPLAQAIIAVVEDAGGAWRGTATELLAAVAGHVDEATRRGKAWPQSPRALAGRLRRMAPDLRRGAGINADFAQVGHEKTRMILLGNTRNIPSAPSAPPEGLGDKASRADGTADAKSAYRPQPSAYRPHTVRAESLEPQGFAGFADGADGADVNLLLSSGLTASEEVAAEWTG